MFRYALLLSALIVGACSSNKPKLAELPPITSPTAIKTVWSLNVGNAGNYSFTPAVDRSRVFVASSDGWLTRIDQGTQVWRTEIAKSLAGGVAIGGDTVVVTTPKAEVLAVSAIDGSVLWRNTVSTEVLAPPVITASLVIVRSGDNQIHALDILTGKIKWAYRRANPPLTLRATGSPVVADQYAFSGFPGGKLLAFNLENGSIVWEGNVSSPKGTTELERVTDVIAPPIVDGRLICASAYQGKLSCFDLNNAGTLAWSRDIASVTGFTADGRYLYVADDKGIVNALDKTSGKTAWQQKALLNRQLTAPVTFAGMLVFGDMLGYVHFLNKEDGRFVGRYPLDGSAVMGVPKVFGSSLVVQTRKGGVYALETQ